MFRCFIGGEGRRTANQECIPCLNLNVRQFHQRFALRRWISPPVPTAIAYRSIATTPESIMRWDKTS